MRKILMVAALMFLSASPALADDYTCPDLQIDQVASRIPQGWLSATLTTNTPQMDGITVYDGPPGEMASLVPDNEGAAEGGNPFWTFEAEKSRMIWMECTYATQSTRLTRALPEAITKCTQSKDRTLSCE